MKPSVFISGKIIDLIVLESEIIETSNWYRWFNDESVTKNMQKHYFPNTKETQLNFFKKEIEGSNVKLQLGVWHRESNLLIGIVSLNNIDFINRACEVAGMIGEEKFQDLNSALEAFKLIVIHAIETLNMNRVYGGSFNRDIDTMFCRLLGFQREGQLRSAVYKNGSYHDAYLHAILKEDFLQKRSSYN
jgi:RimJ/RimL family protein N-acetyltransferase